jgi:hypothetical protein
MMGNMVLWRGSVVGGSVVLGWFVGLGLFLGFLIRKILLYLVGYCVFGHVECVVNGGV